jgi:hypothetical protein
VKLHDGTVRLIRDERCSEVHTLNAFSCAALDSAVYRDRCEAFVGSQSLRKIDMDERREVGVIVRGPKTLSRLVDTFD